MNELQVVGKSVTRVDAAVKADGGLVYGADFRPPGTLHAKLLRSPHPHARIVNIDVSRAQRLSGVRLVVTGRELPHTFGCYIKDEPLLARDRVRYCGEGVAAVVAGDEETAAEALHLIDVAYEPLPALLDYRDSLKEDAPRLHPDLGSYSHLNGVYPVAGTNICNHFKVRKGDIAEGFARADRIFEDTFHLDMIQHAPLEPHVAVAQADAQGRVTVWTVTQSPWECRSTTAEALGLAPGKLRIIALPVGGAFGSKIYARLEPLLVALALRLGGRPVRLLLTREEEFFGAVVRQPTTIRIRTGVTKDGLFLAREIESYWEVGAYADCGPNVCRNGCFQGTGPYRISHVKADGYCVYTNTPISGALRGYGVPEAAWAYECQADTIAKELGIDPLELRLRNAWELGDETATGEPLLTSVGLKETLVRAARDLGWDQPKAPPSSPTKRRGRGIACINKQSRAPTTSSAFVKLHEDGSVEILCSSIEFGQGADTVLCQMAAEVLEVPLEQVRRATPDTQVTPYDRSTSSSRTTFHMGNAVRLAAQDIRQQLVAMASEVFEAPEELVRLEKGAVAVPGREPISYKTLISRYYGAAGSVLGRATFAIRDTIPMDPETGQSPKATAFWLYATQGVELEVDTETGEIELVRVSACHDVGKAINPLNCEQQIEGALSMGLGAALTERLDLVEGKVMNPNFVDYRIFTALDMRPKIFPSLVESNHDQGPWGAKGIGEPGLAPTAAAVGNALYDALGLQLKEIPLTAERVLGAIQEAGGPKPRDRAGGGPPEEGHQPRPGC